MNKMSKNKPEENVFSTEKCVINMSKKYISQLFSMKEKQYIVIHCKGCIHQLLEGSHHATCGLKCILSIVFSITRKFLVLKTNIFWCFHIVFILTQQQILNSGN